MIPTNQWLNTLDTVAPTSRVTGIAAGTGSTANQRTVSWSGADDPGGSGIQDYTLHMSVDGGLWAAVIVNTTATSASLSLACDHHYGFYSLARDNVGNVELAHGRPDVIYQTGGDPDVDGVCAGSDNSDDCPSVANPDQTDNDHYGKGNACDCAPTDAGAFAVPAEVGGVSWAADKATLSWQSVVPGAGSGTVHEVLRVPRSGVRLTDRQWSRLEPLLPRSPRGRKGGRPWIDNRAVLDGIFWVLKTGARWRDLPEGYPSPSTCWRRLKLWEERGVWLRVWRAFLGQLDARGRLDRENVFIDGTFAPAKKGAPRSGKPSGARGRSAWWWSTARVFLWESPSPRPRRRR